MVLVPQLCLWQKLISLFANRNHLNMAKFTKDPFSCTLSLKPSVVHGPPAVQVEVQIEERGANQEPPLQESGEDGKCSLLV